MSRSVIKPNSKTLEIYNILVSLGCKEDFIYASNEIILNKVSFGVSTVQQHLTYLNKYGYILCDTRYTSYNTKVRKIKINKEFSL